MSGSASSLRKEGGGGGTLRASDPVEDSSGLRAMKLRTGPMSRSGYIPCKRLRSSPRRADANGSGGILGMYWRHSTRLQHYIHHTPPSSPQLIPQHARPASPIGQHELAVSTAVPTHSPLLVRPASPQYARPASPQLQPVPSTVVMNSSPRLFPMTSPCRCQQTASNWSKRSPRCRGQSGSFLQTRRLSCQAGGEREGQER